MKSCSQEVRLHFRNFIKILSFFFAFLHEASIGCAGNRRWDQRVEADPGVKEGEQEPISWRQARKEELAFLRFFARSCRACFCTITTFIWRKCVRRLLQGLCRLWGVVVVCWWQCWKEPSTEYCWSLLYLCPSRPPFRSVFRKPFRHASLPWFSCFFFAFPIFGSVAPAFS